jgi:catechol 2,3-dioxygenase-like lactoylglutathione lyase family enzyme
MSLGAFSVSLSVKDLAASIAFYKALGFEAFHDASEHNYAILKNGDAVIGLFQGMFEGNILTINPGWTQDATAVDGDFEDVRDIQSRLQDAGLDIATPADPDGQGPASFMLSDPDGNTILFDQHVEKPKT